MAKAKKKKNWEEILSNIIFSRVFLIILISCLLGLLIYRQVQQRDEKQVFLQLQDALQGLSVKVEREMGIPARSQLKSYCTRDEEKFKIGKRYCGTRVGMNYKANSSEIAKKQAQQLQDLVNLQTIFIANTPGRSTERTMDWYRNSVLKTQYENIGCSFEMSYQNETTNDGSNYIGDAKPGYFSWLIRCTDYASKAYYPEGY